MPFLTMTETNMPISSFVTIMVSLVPYSIHHVLIMVERDPRRPWKSSRKRPIQTQTSKVKTPNETGVRMTDQVVMITEMAVVVPMIIEAVEMTVRVTVVIMIMDVVAVVGRKMTTTKVSLVFKTKNTYL